MACQVRQSVLRVAVTVSRRIVQQGVDVRPMAMTPSQCIGEDPGDDPARVDPRGNRLSAFDAAGAPAHVRSEKLSRRDCDRRAGQRRRSMAHNVPFGGSEQLRHRLMPTMILTSEAMQRPVGRRG